MFDNLHEQRCKDILVSLRKITQAIDLHSRDLSRRFGLTGPQLVLLQEIASNNEITITELASSISLKQATVTDIVNRLQKKGLLVKKRCDQDKRRIRISLTEKGALILYQAPPPLQETFIDYFAELEEWEQLMLLSAMKRVVKMMSAEKIDASPILAAGPPPFNSNSDET